MCSVLVNRMTQSLLMEDKKSKQKKVLSEIQALSESIRRKHRALKRGILETSSTLEKTFQPLVDPLKTLTKQFSEKAENVDKEKRNVFKHIESVSDDKRVEEFTPMTTTAKKLFSNLPDEPMITPSLQRMHTVAETPNSPASVYLSTPEGRREGIEMLDQLPYALLAKEYMKRFITDTSNKMDHTYGPRIVDDKMMIGDGSFDFDNNDLYIKGTRYTGTQGLYELIFMKRPDVDLVTSNDQKAYKSILIATSAHRQKYDPDKQVNSNASYKYRTIIRTLFPRGGKLNSDNVFATKKSVYSNDAVEYVYWNDVNELVERLKLLIASRDAGHTGHNNEIVSILEELREARIIL